MTTPFGSRTSLFHDLDDINGTLPPRNNAQPFKRLPGHPQTKLQKNGLLSFLKNEFVTARLDRFAPWFGLVATPDSRHIYSLTHYVVRGREITITESPELHLVWHDKRIFLKPLPPYLLSYSFWENYLRGEPTASKPTDGTSDDHVHLRRAILGFMRSYGYLVQHPSDFRLAVEKGLILGECLSPDNDLSHRTGGDRESHESPEPGGNRTRGNHAAPASGGLYLASFMSFVKFIENFDHDKVPDTDVSDRYRFGHLRLSRLNFWAKFALHEFTFEKAYGNYDAYFSRFYGPLLFIFGVLSVLLSAFQLAMAADATEGVSARWKIFFDVGKWFSVAVLVCICAVCFVLITLLLFMGAREALFATKGMLARFAESRKNKKDGTV